jgi:hypothetical protein
VYFNPVNGLKQLHGPKAVLDKLGRSSSDTQTLETLNGLKDFKQERHRAQINNYYRRKMQLVCIFCFFILIFSQGDARFTSRLLKVYSEVDFSERPRNLTSPYQIDEEEYKRLSDKEKTLLFMDREFINDVA